MCCSGTVCTICFVRRCGAQIQDIYPYAIALTWKQASVAAGASANGVEGAEDAAQGNQIVFSKANPLPSSKLLTFYRTETFTIDAFYAEARDLAPDYNLRIGTFTVSSERSLRSRSFNPRTEHSLRSRTFTPRTKC